LALAPLTLRKKLTTLIKNEATLAREGKPSSVILKMNKLSDRGLIEELYAASAAGVKITLIVRGICCLRPGIKGLSENIEVRSVVGRFLEHSRIFCFSNGYDLGHEKAKIFISSADLMTHKIDRRIEVIVPIKAPYIKQQILENIIEPYLNDRAQTWLLQSDGSYYRENKDPKLNIHEALLAPYKSS
jgi:polyphosphate kinase